ncbi:MAG TPA: TM1812 family CRISPR-associated protein [Candidatus Thiothrix moscowensis]|uniref:CRISPR-associated DxTHG motif protein n=1 Tax=unclassified Thiothrix TaxID=2636184 RepID=UPI0025F3E374|nr:MULTISPECIES: TM1812 family CRISPR-associated protein [unclassified Thiothrix]HRJ53617.1 TM1812 family CRISPR-associated protein [Candidatus Thiothrix moscowensis]HRJ93698.1 TM1812 family CRISPR-associated protein [Candidatus Thiothrix moscowensis]
MYLISFLGLGEAKRDPNGKPTGEYVYQQTTYRFGQDPQTDIHTCYVVRAIAQHYAVQEITLLATEQAEKAHHGKLSDELQSQGLPQPCIARVPFGANAEQQWEQFGVILDSIPRGKDKQVIFDITHGFRAQPFFAAAVINYIRATWAAADVPQMRILYGEYNRDKQVSDVWDMTTFISLLDWSSSLQDFITTGNGQALAALAKRENAAVQKVGQNARPTMLAKLAEAIRTFSENLATVRVPHIITATAQVRGSAANVLHVLAEAEDEVRTHFKPLYPVLGNLKAKLQGIPAASLFTPTGHQAMLKLAKLYVDYERYPEAAIVLREGWISLYAASDRNNQQLLEKCERSATECRWYETESKASKGHADILSKVRNDIQHGGFRPDPAPAQALIKNLGELLGAFAAKLGVTPLESGSPEKTTEEPDDGNIGMSGGYLAALMIGEKAAQGFEIVIEEVKNQGGQGLVLHQRIEGRTFIIETNDQNLIIAARSYLAVKKSFF